MWGTRPTLLVLVSLALALAGCGRSSDERDARRTAETLYASAADRPVAACATLTPATAQALEQQEKKSCAKPIDSVDLSRGRTEGVKVFGTSASVRFSSGELAFLDETGDGWRVAAAGCKPQGKEPAECELED